MKENEDIIVRVNAEFKTKDEARIQPLKYRVLLGEFLAVTRLTVYRGL